MVGYFVSRSQLHYTSSLSDPPAATYSSRSSIQMPISHTFSRFSSSSRASNLFQRENKRKKDEPWQISSCRRCRSRMNGSWRRSEFHYCWPLFYPILSWWLSLEQVWKGKGNINHICQKQRTIWWEANNYHLGFKNSTSSAASAAFRHHYVLYANIADAQYCWPHL